jgi:hypothetical protein
MENLLKLKMAEVQFKESKEGGGLEKVPIAITSKRTAYLDLLIFAVSQGRAAPNIPA